MNSVRRTALVLGATGGLGEEVARRLLGLSATLLVHGPNREQTERLAAELGEMDERCQVLPVVADFASLDAVRELVRRCADASELDTVVNAVDLLPPRSRILTGDGNEVTWQVNYLGPALASLGLLPQLRRSAIGRMVHVVRDQHGVGVPRADEPAAGRRYYPAWSYTESKLALMMLSQTIAGQLRGSGARSVAMQPAGVEVGAVQAPLSRGLMVDAVLYACTSPAVPNGAYLRGRRVHPLPRAAAGVATQQRMWRATCRILSLDPRTGHPQWPSDPVGETVLGRSPDIPAG
jgi:NAD(P)-dependent dehydrogenase (short-subunit alcohol dehydrogenase family)